MVIWRLKLLRDQGPCFISTYIERQVVTFSFCGRVHASVLQW